jgi:predicted metal-dependent enzyme (double-stranded beta helix superfamily)
VDTATTPPAFPNGSGRQVVDNARTTGWEFVPPPGAGAPPHRHLRDGVVVSFEGQTPHVSFVTRGTVHNDEGTGRADRAYIFELK